MDSADIHGFLIVDKPPGVTSFSMVSLVRRLTGVRRVGHAGTLDPMASGVLPVAVGQAARFIEYMDDELKTYLARVRFGATTDTYDAEGAVTSTGDASGLDAAAVEAALAVFEGWVEQTPPVYSALKVAGKPLYRYAREGAEVVVAARSVYVDRAELLSFDAGEAEIEVRCGKGTYIRSIAHDLGLRLGCGAHLSALRRAATGGFTLADARRPEELSALAEADRLVEALLAVDRAVERRPAAVFDRDHSVDVACGRDVAFDAAAGPDLCRAYGVEGGFLGVLRRVDGWLWHPEKVVPGASRGVK